MASQDEEVPGTSSPLQRQSAPPLRKSYANATSTEKFPKDDQAVAVAAIENRTVEDYVSQLIKVVNRENIKAISRISNNRICEYLASRKIADDLIDKN